jgi:nicotinate-nucleotide pyrophosphorylase (carboxylating)
MAKRPEDSRETELSALYEEFSQTGLIRKAIRLAKAEDLGDESVDITSDVIVPEASRVTADVVAREPGVAAGVAMVGDILDAFAPATVFRELVRDGRAFERGAVLGTLLGSRRQILTAERTLLNFLGRLCGVATQARAYVNAVGEGVKAKVYDTRKTTPGLRALEKYAVRCGGAESHRMGLHDAVLIKDNHLAGIAPERVADVVASAAEAARERQVEFVEIEADTLEQVEIFLGLETGLIDFILLDNMSPDQLREAVAMRDRMNPGIQLEASGGVTLESMREIALTGVDRISSGAMTHAARWLDIGLDVGPDIA